jgi:hypothetical protein
LIVINTKKSAKSAPQVWLACAFVASWCGFAMAQGKGAGQLDGPKRTSNGLIIKSSGSFQTPQIKAPSQFKTPAGTQVKLLQEQDARRSQQLQASARLSPLQNARPTGLVTAREAIAKKDRKGSYGAGK